LLNITGSLAKKGFGDFFVQKGPETNVREQRLRYMSSSLGTRDQAKDITELPPYRIYYNSRKPLSINGYTH
jgi:hypothetical protein